MLARGGSQRSLALGNTLVHENENPMLALLQGGGDGGGGSGGGGARGDGGTSGITNAAPAWARLVPRDEATKSTQKWAATGAKKRSEKKRRGEQEQEDDDEDDEDLDLGYSFQG